MLSILLSSLRLVAENAISLFVPLLSSSSTSLATPPPPTFTLLAVMYFIFSPITYLTSRSILLPSVLSISPLPVLQTVCPRLPLSLNLPFFIPCLPDPHNATNATPLNASCINILPLAYSLVPIAQNRDLLYLLPPPVPVGYPGASAIIIVLILSASFIYVGERFITYLASSRAHSDNTSKPAFALAAGPVTCLSLFVLTSKSPPKNDPDVADALSNIKPADDSLVLSFIGETAAAEALAASTAIADEDERSLGQCMSRFDKLILSLRTSNRASDECTPPLPVADEQAPPFPPSPSLPEYDEEPPAFLSASSPQYAEDTDEQTLVQTSESPVECDFATDIEFCETPLVDDALVMGLVEETLAAKAPATFNQTTDDVNENDNELMLTMDETRVLESLDIFTEQVSPAAKDNDENAGEQPALINDSPVLSLSLLLINGDEEARASPPSSIPRQAEARNEDEAEAQEIAEDEIHEELLALPPSSSPQEAGEAEEDVASPIPLTCLTPLPSSEGKDHKVNDVEVKAVHEDLPDLPPSSSPEQEAEHKDSFEFSFASAFPTSVTPALLFIPGPREPSPTALVPSPGSILSFRARPFYISLPPPMRLVVPTPQPPSPAPRLPIPPAPASQSPAPSSLVLPPLRTPSPPFPPAVSPPPLVAFPPSPASSSPPLLSPHAPSSPPRTPSPSPCLCFSTSPTPPQAPCPPPRPPSPPASLPPPATFTFPGNAVGLSASIWAVPPAVAEQSKPTPDEDGFIDALAGLEASIWASTPDQTIERKPAPARTSRFSPRHSRRKSGSRLRVPSVLSLRNVTSSEQPTDESVLPQPADSKAIPTPPKTSSPEPAAFPVPGADEDNDVDFPGDRRGAAASIWADKPLASQIPRLSPSVSIIEEDPFPGDWRGAAAPIRADKLVRQTCRLPVSLAPPVLRHPLPSRPSTSNNQVSSRSNQPSARPAPNTSASAFKEAKTSPKSDNSTGDVVEEVDTSSPVVDPVDEFPGDHRGVASSIWASAPDVVNSGSRPASPRQARRPPTALASSLLRHPLPPRPSTSDNLISSRPNQPSPRPASNTSASASKEAKSSAAALTTTTSSSCTSPAPKPTNSTDALVDEVDTSFPVADPVDEFQGDRRGTAASMWASAPEVVNSSSQPRSPRQVRRPPTAPAPPLLRHPLPTRPPTALFSTYQTDDNPPGVPEDVDEFPGDRGGAATSMWASVPSVDNSSSRQRASARRQCSYRH